MSANKYANLPDIDTAQDIYETEDTFPTRAGGDSSEDESGVPARPAASAPRAGKNGEPSEGLDSSHLIDVDEAGKKFRKAERKHNRPLISIYSYPPSSPPSPTEPSHSRSLQTRLRALQAEMASLEADLSDPTNPLLADDETGDPGALMRGLVEVRSRLEKVKKDNLKDGRGKLVETVLGERDVKEGSVKETAEKERQDNKAKKVEEAPQDKKGVEQKSTNIADMDRRIGELEDLVGSSSVALDETSPLPAPLLPMLTKLNTQLTLLSQPRHIDSISRRLKLLISDLDRLSASQNTHGSSKRHAAPGSAPAQASALQEQLLPMLTRLSPHLPHIPHMLTRMRTLSSLHAAAAEFQGTLSLLEEEQRRTRGRLDVLTKAVESVEKSLDENANVVRGNVTGLEERIDRLVKRLGALESS